MRPANAPGASASDSTAHGERLGSGGSSGAPTNALLNGLQPLRSKSSHEQEPLLSKISMQLLSGGSHPSTPTGVVRRRQFTVEELQQLQPGTPNGDAEDGTFGGGDGGSGHGAGSVGGPSRLIKPRYESLDYEEIENTVYRSDKASSSSLDSLLAASSKWFVCFVIGVATAAAAFFVNFSVENISGFKFWATLTILERGSTLGSFLAYALMNVTLVLASVGLTLFVGPAAAGSGITDVKAYLNGIDVPGIFYLSTLVAKIIGSIAAVSGGLAVGKEGPFVHAGACIAALVSQGGTPGCQLPVMKNLWNDRDRADMVTAGAAAGVAAAFRSPVGGVLFALEEMSSWWRNQLMWLIFFTTAVVSVTVRLLMKACSDEHCGFFGSGGFIYFEIQEGQEAYELYELLPMLLLGVVGGLLGSCFIVLNAWLVALRRKHLARYGVRGRLMEGAVISLITSAVSFTLPLIFACQRCPSNEAEVCPRKDNSHSGNFVAFGCTHPHTYSDLATLFFNTQDDAIRALFSSRTKREYTVPALVIFVTSFFWLAVITYGVSCPTGLFVPSILCGAAYGRLVGIFVADMYPHQHIDEGTYALLGAASFLGGSMRMTVCTCVMLLELTDNLALLPLIMLVLLVAKAVGDGTGVKPIYESQMEYKGLPFLEPTADAITRHVTARECCGKPPVTFSRVERVQRIVEVLRAVEHNGFPVVHQTNAEGDRALAGVVLRQHLLLLLNARTAFQATPYVTEAASRVATTFSEADFTKPMSAPGLSIHDVLLTPEELAQYLDLGPYLNPSYYVVQEDASLSKVYTLFRTLGLRHLCVIPKAQEAVGIITREDLLPQTLEERLALGGGQFGTDGTLASWTGHPDASGRGGRHYHHHGNGLTPPHRSTTTSYAPTPPSLSPLKPQRPRHQQHQQQRVSTDGPPGAGSSGAGTSSSMAAGTSNGIPGLTAMAVLSRTQPQQQQQQQHQQQQGSPAVLPPLHPVPAHGDVRRVGARVGGPGPGRSSLGYGGAGSSGLGGAAGSSSRFTEQRGIDTMPSLVPSSKAGSSMGLQGSGSLPRESEMMLGGGGLGSRAVSGALPVRGLGSSAGAAYGSSGEAAGGAPWRGHLDRGSNSSSASGAAPPLSLAGEGVAGGEHIPLLVDPLGVRPAFKSRRGAANRASASTAGLTGSAAQQTGI